MINLIKLAEQGDVNSQYELGIKYYQKGEEELAFAWIKEAAEQGLSDAQIDLAKCYKRGIGVGQDFHCALCWYEKAAQQGNADAMNELALHYYNGQGCNVDYSKTLMWFEEAAHLGHPQATFNLGVSYAEGVIVKRDMAKAKKLFLQAEELGSEEASSALANMDDDDDYDYDEEFDTDEFTYSIDVASKIYAKLKTQEAANKEFYEQLEDFFAEHGLEYECSNGSGVTGFGGCTYKSDMQTITVLVEFANEPSVYGIILPTYGAYTKQLFNDGLNNKCLFGLPIFTMQWYDEMDRAFIYFINRESYLEFDTPKGRKEKDLFGF